LVVTKAPFGTPDSPRDASPGPDGNDRTLYHLYQFIVFYRTKANRAAEMEVQAFVVIVFHLIHIGQQALRNLAHFLIHVNDRQLLYRQ
jgi:hypothetical protein